MDLDVTVRELAPQLLRYALGRTGDAALAEEVAQDALTALVQRWRRFGAPECPAAFAFAIARRRAVRAGLRSRLLLPLQVLLEGRSPLPDPEEQAAGRSALDRTLAAIRRLPRRDREALLLVAAGEAGLAESARVLGISLSALKMRLHRARKRLAELLEERTIAHGGSRAPHPPDLADTRLREALEPAPEAVGRIVRRALADPERGHRATPRWRAVWAGAGAPAVVPGLTALALAALALMLAWQLDRFRIAPARRPAAISIVNEGGVVIATSPSGDWLIRGAQTEPRSPGLILVAHGDTEE